MEEVFSEFYFGYEVSCNLLESRFPDRLLKEDRWKAWAEARKPKLHVQRIYKYNDRYLSDSKPHYQLFMVLPHWNRYLEYEIEKSSRKPEEIANAPKEEAHVVFDRDWALLRETVQEGQKPEIDKRYRLKGEDRQQNVYAYTGSCRVKFDNGREDMENSDRDFSGAGYVELSWDENGTEYCIKFDYFVNFVFRKPVYYSLKVAHGAVVAKWSGCVYGKDLPVKLLHSAAGRP